MDSRLHIVLPGEYTTQNQYIQAERTHLQRAAGIKSSETERVKLEVMSQFGVDAIPKVTSYPVDVTIFWYRTDRRSDPDNVAFAVKFILDGLQAAGVLRNDGWKQINSICHIFRIDKNAPRVEIFLEMV